MANTDGKANLFTVIVKKGKEEEALLSLLALDSDFDFTHTDDEEEGLEIVREICKKHKTLKKQIDEIIDYSDDDGNQFLIGNEGYCSDYEVEITKIDKDTQVVAIAYIT